MKFKVTGKKVYDRDNNLMRVGDIIESDFPKHRLDPFAFELVDGSVLQETNEVKAKIEEKKEIVEAKQEPENTKEVDNTKVVTENEEKSFEAIKDNYTVAELKDIADKNGISIHHKAKEDKIIQILIDAGVKL